MSRVSRENQIQGQELAAIAADDAVDATCPADTAMISTPAGAPGQSVKLAMCGSVLVAIGVLLGIAGAGVRVLPGDEAILEAVQRPEWFGWDRLAWVASRVGDPVPALMIGSACAVVCVIRKRADLALVILLATAVRAISPSLKALFESQRPSTDLASIMEHVDSFGYPSGHAFGAALVYGMVAIVAPRLFAGTLAGRVARVLAMMMVVLIPLSRVRLGVHWPSDVAGGMAFGLGIDCLLLAGFQSVAWQKVRT